MNEKACSFPYLMQKDSLTVTVSRFSTYNIASLTGTCVRTSEENKTVRPCSFLNLAGFISLNQVQLHVAFLSLTCVYGRFIFDAVVLNTKTKRA